MTPTFLKKKKTTCSASLSHVNIWSICCSLSFLTSASSSHLSLRSCKSPINLCTCSIRALLSCDTSLPNAFLTGSANWSRRLCPSFKVCSAATAIKRNTKHIYIHVICTDGLHRNVKIKIECPGLTCGTNIVKPRFLYKTVDLWSFIMPIWIDTLIRSKVVYDFITFRVYVSIYR